MGDLETVVIVGASMAGAKAAEAMRKNGFEGRVLLVGEEPEPPYERPPLSKDYLRGAEEPDHLWVLPADFYAQQRVELRTRTRVTAIDPGRREVTLEPGGVERWDRLLIATGSRPRRLDAPGGDLPGIHYLRTKEDSDALRAAIEGGGHVVSIGGGWIGAEVAASARQMGAEVTLVTPTRLPLERVLGPDVADVYRDLHAEHGVRFQAEARVVGFEGSGRVERVRTADGRSIEGDVVVVGIGAEPRAELAEAAGLEVEAGGILTDEYLETSVPGIYAAGDVAAQWHPILRQRVRVEHWGTARFGGTAAGRNMVAERKAFDRMPYFYSDQFDLSMEYWGWAPRWDHVVFRGDPKAPERSFVAGWFRDGRLVAALVANEAADRKQVEALVKAQARVDPDRFADPAVPIPELAPSG